MRLLPLILLAFAIRPVPALDLSVDQIMAKVAENQARAQEMRKAYIYDQKVLARFTRSNGTLAREEKLEYQVTPTAEGTEKKLTHFEGTWADKGKVAHYDEPGKERKD